MSSYETVMIGITLHKDAPHQEQKDLIDLEEPYALLDLLLFRHSKIILSISFQQACPLFVSIYLMIRNAVLAMMLILRYLMLDLFIRILVKNMFKVARSEMRWQTLQFLTIFYIFKIYRDFFQLAVELFVKVFTIHILSYLLHVLLVYNFLGCYLLKVIPEKFWSIVIFDLSLFWRSLEIWMMSHIEPLQDLRRTPIEVFEHLLAPLWKECEVLLLGSGWLGRLRSHNTWWVLNGYRITLLNLDLSFILLWETPSYRIVDSW